VCDASPQWTDSTQYKSLDCQVRRSMAPAHVARCLPYRFSSEPPLPSALADHRPVHPLHHPPDHHRVRHHHPASAPALALQRPLHGQGERAAGGCRAARMQPRS
jgi:hypothetical protein